MHADPDYSAAYVILRTDQPGLEGHGLTFTLGRGTELCVAAAEYLCRPAQRRVLDDITQDFAGFWRRLVRDGQFRWIGPEKGVVHLATAAVINALWDLWAKAEGKPLWKLLTDMPAEQLVSTVDFSYLTDVLTPADAVAIVEGQRRHPRGPRGRAPPHRLPRLHDLRRLARATRTKGSSASCAKELPPAGTTSSSKSAQTSPTTAAGPPWSAARSAPTAS